MVCSRILILQSAVTKTRGTLSVTDADVPGANCDTLREQGGFLQGMDMFMVKSTQAQCSLLYVRESHKVV